MNTLKMLAPLTAFAALVVLGACSSQALYATGQNLQKQECRKIPDLAERSRCERSADLSYERYREEAAPARPSLPGSK